MKRIFLFVVFLTIAASVANAAEPEPYRLGPEDGIRVQVWQRPDLSGTYQVDDSGNITVPLLGKVNAAGLTADELGKELQRRYVILDPRASEVLVTVVQYSSRFLTVVGEVRNPGRYSFRTIPNLWDALLSAGGATPAADMSRVQIVRREKGKEKQQTLTVDLSLGREKTAEETVPELQAGDSIIVPAIEQNVVSGDLIQVLGAVRSPGLYPLRAADTVVEAIGVSGGALGNANLDRVKLIRRGKAGTVVYELDIQEYLDRGYPEADLPLQAGDTITIPASRGGLRNVLGTVFSVAPLLSAVASILVLTRN